MFSVIVLECITHKVLKNYDDLKTIFNNGSNNKI